MRPRTKHIALKYYHFRKHVRDGTISVRYVETDRQIADIFTKTLSDANSKPHKNCSRLSPVWTPSQ